MNKLVSLLLASLVMVAAAQAEPGSGANAFNQLGEALLTPNHTGVADDFNLIAIAVDHQPRPCAQTESIEGASAGFAAEQIPMYR